MIVGDGKVEVESDVEVLVEVVDLDVPEVESESILD